jgi:ATP-binding cassette, subfamily B, multidrug efflux pump
MATPEAEDVVAEAGRSTPTPKAKTKRKKGTASAPETRQQRALREFHEEDEIAKTFDRANLARLWPFVKPQGRLLAVSLGSLVVLAGLALVRPLVMRAGFDAAAGAGGASSLYKAGALLAGIVIFEQVMTFAQMLALQVVGARAMADLRNHVFAFLHSRRLAFFDQQPVGRLVTRVTNDIDAIGEMFASGALNAFGDILKLVGIVVVMVIVNWKLALIAFAALPIVGLLVNWVRGRARDALRAIRTKTARLNSFLSEAVTGMAVTQAYSREAAAEEEFDGINAAYRDANFQSILFDSALDAAVEMVSSICVAALIWYSGARPFGEEVSFGTLVAFIAYLEQFFGPIRDLSARYNLLQSSMTGAERVFLLLDNTEEDAPLKAGAPPGDASIALAFEDVTFAYKPDHTILDHVSIEVRTGERVALVGATGAGKSTIASLALRLYDASAGVVRVMGKDVTTVPRKELRRAFAVVPQDVFLFPGTVAENVAVGDVVPDLDKVKRALDRVGALDLFTRREEGLDARVDERGANFSAGERQLLAFARAVYRDAEILVLDEATANVDSDTEARLQAGVESLLEARTSLIIAHRLSTVRKVDRIVVLAKGKVMEQGSHDELIERGGLYARLHALGTALE